MAEQVKENENQVMEEVEVENEKMDSGSQQEEITELKEEEIEEKVEESEEVVELKKQIEELESRLLRSKADFENYKKRTRVEKEELAKYANVRLIGEILPIFDNFKRAIDSSDEMQNIDSLIEGVKMVYRQLEEMLTKEGLEPIESIGHTFNPEQHQAVMQVESDEHDSGVVVEELQKGYKLKDKVIRPSMVKVNA